MRGSPIRIRAFILATALALVLVPTIAAGAAWFVVREHQQTDIHQRLNSAITYLSSHRSEMREPHAVEGFTRLLGRLDLLAQLTLVSDTPPGKSKLYASPALLATGTSDTVLTGSTATAKASWTDVEQHIPITTSKPKITLAIDLYYRPASGATQALVALVSGIIVLLAELVVSLWLAGRWIVAPLAKLSDQVDNVAGGDVMITIPSSRIGEIANIGQAVEGMATAIGESAHRRAEADEARRFLVASVAHDLRTPLFALRGHLQAIGTRLGNATKHLEQAEARADALQRLIDNLFAYTRDDYVQPMLQLESVPIAELLHEVAAGLAHADRLGDKTFNFDGDQALIVMVDLDRFNRAFTNILDNALRYSPEGASIQLSWAATNESSVRITVRDRGPGIDPALIPHVLEPGIRGDPAMGNADGGAGLGLAIAKRLLDHQHAALTINNHQSGGVLVSVTLQRAPFASSTRGDGVGSTD